MFKKSSKSLQKSLKVFKCLQSLQKSSKVFKRPQKSSNIFKSLQTSLFHQKPLKAIKTLQNSSKVFKLLQKPSKPSKVFKRLQKSSNVFKRLQRSPMKIEIYNYPWKYCLFCCFAFNKIPLGWRPSIGYWVELGDIHALVTVLEFSEEDMFGQREIA